MRILTALIVISAPAPALAWGPTGHRITGVIAEANLSGIARAQVQQILGKETLAEAANWPDEMRSHPSEFWRETSTPWHYVTVPIGETYARAKAPAEGDAMVALKRYAAILKDPKGTLEGKQAALRFIVHIIGDLHQPLHAGKPGDRGGNDVEVTFFSAKSNLHSVWDSGLIDHRKLSYTEYAAWLSKDLTPEQVVQWWSPDPIGWISESTKLRDTIYPVDSNLSWNYAFEHTPNVDLRLSMAGVRIAAFLNETLE